jgi:hypothetical protein
MWAAAFSPDIPLDGSSPGNATEGEPVLKSLAVVDDINVHDRGDRLQKRLRTRLHITVHHDLAVLVQDTYGQGAGMEQATGKLMLISVESPEVPSSP